MPELPELEVYKENLATLVAGREVTGVSVRNVFTVRTAEPALASIIGRSVASTGRHGKHLLIAFDGGLHLVFHLKLSGRLRWKKPGTKLNAGIGCLQIDFAHGSLHMTEASSQKSASLHVTQDLPTCPELDCGIDALAATQEQLRAALSLENRQLKGALTDQRIVMGIGNAYSDEALFAARLSPLRLTGKISEAEWEALHLAVQGVLREWIARVRDRARGDLPTEQGAWREAMKVHGKFGSPCPACGRRIERIAYADNETHYCPACQCGGKKLSDRRIDRLLR